MKKIFALILMILCETAAVFAAEPASQPSNTFKAFRKVRIDAPPCYLDTVRQFQSQVLTQGFDPNFDHYGTNTPTISIDQSATDDAPTVLISVEVKKFLEPSRPYLKSTQPPVFFYPTGGIAAETADKILAEYRLRLARWTQIQRAAWKAELADQNAQNDDLQNQRAHIESKLGVLESELSDIFNDSGLADCSPQSVRELAIALEGQFEATAVDISGKSARETSLAAAIAKLSDQVAGALSADPIASQLEEVVNVRLKELEDAKRLRAAATVSDADVDRAVAALAEAKAAVLERKEAAANAAGADTVHKWNDDLLSLSIDLDELHARMKELQIRLQKLRQTLNMVDGKPSVESISKSLEEINAHLMDSQAKIPSLQAKLDADQPKLTVIESKDEPAPN